MQDLKRLALSLTLISAFAVCTMAGETAAPPCAPGETAAPPCPAQSVNDESTTPSETPAAPASDTTVSVTALAEAVLWALSLF